MNLVVLTGRLVRDPDVRYGSETAVCRFTVAVERPKRQGQKESEADFINCLCFGKRGETIGNYMTKGSKINVKGSIRTGSYTNKAGVKVYTTEVLVDDFEFAESKGSNNNHNNNSNNSPMASMGTSYDEADIDF